MTQNDLKLLLAEDKTKQVLDWLLQTTGKLPDTDLYNEVVQQSSRFNDYLREKAAGTKSQENLDIQKANINAALAYIIDKLPGSAGAPAVPGRPPAGPGRYRTGWLAGIGLVLVVIAVVIFFPKPGGAFEITVNLVAPKLPDYPPLKDAELQIKLDNRWAPATVDEFGDADFKGIPSEFNGKMVAVRLQSDFWQTQQDSVLLEGKSTSVEVAPNGRLETLSGIVRNVDGSGFLPGVEIRLENSQIMALTDSSGYFEISVPIAQQKEQYSLIAIKDGFEPYSQFAYPTGNLDIRLSPKK